MALLYFPVFIQLLIHFVRFALVPQPDQHPSQSAPQASGPASESRLNPSSPTQSSSNSNRGSDGGNRNGTGQAAPGFIQSIFSNLMGLAHPQSGETNDSNNNRTGSPSHSRDNSYNENAGQRGSGGNPSSPPRDRPRSPPAQQNPGSPRRGTEYSTYRRSPLHSPLPSSYNSRASPSSPTFGSRLRPGSPPPRNSPPSRRDSDNVNGARGSSAPPGSPGSAAQRRRDQQNDGHNSLPGSWSDDLD
jgi:hypothetical protein